MAMITMRESYRDLLVEEKPLLVANHPKGSQRLLPSIVPGYSPGFLEQIGAHVACVQASVIALCLERPLKAGRLAACDPGQCHPTNLPLYSIWCLTCWAWCVYCCESVSVA
jgi:hypothetical protein